MDAGRRHTVQTGLCAFAALLLATVLGAVAHTDTPRRDSSAHAGHAQRTHAVAPAPQQLTRTPARANDPVGFDVVAAETSGAIAEATGAAAGAASSESDSIQTRIDPGRDPPGGGQV